MWSDKTGYRGDIENTMSEKGHRNYRSHSMPGSYIKHEPGFLRERKEAFGAYDLRELT